MLGMELTLRLAQQKTEERAAKVAAAKGGRAGAEERRAQATERQSVARAEQAKLHALAYNLANFMRTLAWPEGVAHWSLTSLREKLVKIGAKIVTHGRHVTFQMAEVAVPRDLFNDILRLIAELRPPPAAAPA